MPDPINYKEIGKRIKIARIQGELTQEKLAETVGISSSHLSNIETGNARVSLPTLVHIANALEVSISDLLCDNLKKAKDSYCKECDQLLSDCSEKEIRFITDLISAALCSLRKNNAFDDSAASSDPRNFVLK